MGNGVEEGRMGRSSGRVWIDLHQMSQRSEANLIFFFVSQKFTITSWYLFLDFKRGICGKECPQFMNIFFSFPFLETRRLTYTYRLLRQRMMMNRRLLWLTLLFAILWRSGKCSEIGYLMSSAIRRRLRKQSPPPIPRMP